MASIIQNIQKRSSSLPISQDQSPQQGPGIRRRLSSLSLKLQPSPSTYSWPFPRSKSLPSMASYEFSGLNSLRKWWDWGWAWILSRKVPIFCEDLELNEQESKILGSHNQGSWRHVFFKVRSELRRIVRSNDKVGLPQTVRYNSYSYSNNFQG